MIKKKYYLLLFTLYLKKIHPKKIRIFAWRIVSFRIPSKRDTTCYPVFKKKTCYPFTSYPLKKTCDFFTSYPLKKRISKKIKYSHDKKIRYSQENIRTTFFLHEKWFAYYANQPLLFHDCA